MVSIRKVKQQGFQLRRTNGGTSPRGGGSPYDPEKVGLMAAGLCIGFLVVILYNLVFADDGGSGHHPRGIPEALRNTKRHPILTEPIEDGVKDLKQSVSKKDPQEPPKQKAVRPMGDNFNAIALDIIDTLDCTKLLEDAVKSLKQFEVGGRGGGYHLEDGSMKYGKERDQVETSRHRRLLDEVAQQHGDDGGFGNEVIGDGAAAAEAGGDDAIPEEKWGKEAVEEPIGGVGVGAGAGGGGGGVNDLKYGGGGGGDFGEGDDKQPWFDDFSMGRFGPYVDLTAKHLFCLAATENPPDEVKREIQCDASNLKRRTLLELWSAARAQVQDQVLLKVLGMAREHSNQELLGKSYNIWAPYDDDGLPYMISSLNSEKDADNGGFHGLDESLGPGKVFVDVGSCLGLTCLAINSKYPGTKIVSLEPASPNWLLQEMNLRCNLDHEAFKKVHVVLAGVGPNTDEEDNMMAKLMWRPTSTTATRAWTPAKEYRKDDVELVVRLRRLKSILAEANVYDSPINVLNVDCQGCEYNLIPALTEAEFEAIPTVMGAVHWGYIPTNKLPSSARAKITHERLCQHENIARVTKECCAFPDLPVKSSVPGEILVRDHGNKANSLLDQQSTVSDVAADGLCSDFSSWAAEHFLYDVKDDWGWFELSSQA